MEIHVVEWIPSPLRGSFGVESVLQGFHHAHVVRMAPPPACALSSFQDSFSGSVNSLQPCVPRPFRTPSPLRSTHRLPAFFRPFRTPSPHRSTHRLPAFFRPFRTPSFRFGLNSAADLCSLSFRACLFGSHSLCHTGLSCGSLLGVGCLRIWGRLCLSSTVCCGFKGDKK